MNFQQTIAALLFLILIGLPINIAPAQNSIVKPTVQPKSEANSNEDQQEKEATDSVGNQAQTADSVGLSFSDPIETNWRVGAVIFGGNFPVENLRVAIPVPADWPEQTVEIVKEEFPAEITAVEYDQLDNGPRRLTFIVPNVQPKQKIIVLATYRVSTMQMIAPSDTSGYKIPPKKEKATKAYLAPSPEITWRDSKLKKKAKELADVHDTDWNKVKTIFDWVRDNIEQRAGEPVGSKKAFHAASGAAEDLVSLFVAMCRANKIPSRMVFVDGTQYAEFYLHDAEGVGHWFPANVAGIREFGEIGEPRVILQKGDNVRVAGEKKKLKFVPAAAISTGTKPAAVKFVREPLPIN